jgi:predicted GNAT family acetyltransferase
LFKDGQLFLTKQIFFAWFLLSLATLIKATMLILHKEDNNKGLFYIEQDGEQLAEMVYHISHNQMVIEHTEVNESLRGQNVGFQLVENGVEYAREKHLKIVPFCHFAKKVIQRTEAFQDVLQ